MAAEKDTPAARKSREAAAEVVVASAAPRRPNGRAAKTQTTTGRRPVPGEVVSLVASAARIDLQDKRAMQSAKKRRQAWQSEAWDYVDEVPEIGYTISYSGNMLSKLRLFAATRPDPKEAPVPVEEPESGADPTAAKIAVASLERLRSPEGGQSALIRSLAINLEVAGEGSLHGHEDEDTGEEEWYIRSVDELVVEGDKFALRDGPGSKVLEPIPDGDVVIRLWERHPRFGMLATCAMRRVLTEAEALLLLSREIRAGSKSRLSNGILLMPLELSFGAADPTRDAGDGETQDDPFEDGLITAMITPIQEEGSAAAVVPFLVRGPAEQLKEIRHITLAKPLDAVLDSRIEARIIRIARGLNMPVEVTSGLMSTTFANAAQVKASEFEDHLQPRAVLICDALTAGYLQPALIEAGVDVEKARDIFIWFDATDLVSRPDQADQAQSAHADGIISDDARRRYTGFTEADAPTDDEVLRRLMLTLSRMDPSLFAQMMKQTGLFPNVLIPAPPGGIIVEPGAPTPIIVGGSSPTAEASTVGGPADELPAPPAPKGLPPGVPVGPVVAPPKAGQESAVPVPGPDRVVTAAAGRPVTVAGLGARLTQIDSQLRARVTVALDQAMRRSLERAGSRIRAKVQRDKGGGASAVRQVADGKPNAQVAAALGRELVAAAGLTDGELLADSFESVVADVMAWVAAAQAAAVRALDAAAGPLPTHTGDELDRRQEAGLALARVWLGDAMTRIAARRLYAVDEPAGRGEADPSLTVPASVARAAIGLAGGSRPRGGEIPLVAAAWVDIGPLVAEDGGPMGGVGTGPDLMDAAAAVDVTVEAYQWVYGYPDRPFPPHEALADVVFENFDDDALINSEGWPSDYAFPGDHDGCSCDITPVLVGPSDTGDALDKVSVDTDGLAPAQAEEE